MCNLNEEKSKLNETNMFPVKDIHDYFLNPYAWYSSQQANICIIVVIESTEE